MSWLSNSVSVVRGQPLKTKATGFSVELPGLKKDSLEVKLEDPLRTP